MRRLAYLYSPEDKFTLASGRESPHFFDMKPVMMDPECAHLLGIMFLELLVDILTALFSFCATSNYRSTGMNV